jgi:hypothetical protein
VTGSPSAIYETPKTLKFDTGKIGEEEEVDDEGDGGGDDLEEVHQFGTEHFGELASPYGTPYVYNRPYLDRDFGIRKDNDGQFRIGNSLIEIDKHNSNVIFFFFVYKGTKGLFEFLTRKKVNHSLISKQDLKNYKRILQVTRGQIEDNDPSGDIKTRRGPKFREVISLLFPSIRKRVVETVLGHKWLRYK